MNSKLTIKWGTQNIITFGVYFSLSLLFTLILAFLFITSGEVDVNVKFSYSLLTILGAFATFSSVWNLLKAKKGYSDVLIDHEKVVIQNRSLGYKEDFEFEISRLKSLTLIQENISFIDKLKTLLMNRKGQHYNYHLCVVLKNEEKPKKIFPEARLSVEELKSIADQIQHKIQEYKVD
ncbi:hypothetical protein [Flammeovirga sp. OC4]|uniref:hypothetical protein n=1 Tax=Flammeovirga sp. OC4 TaxID=1382345 RepID=UPI0005C49E22|nr:hypothetical protein [Flammeovirga sp. OC4]